MGELTKIKTGDSDLQDAAPDGVYPFFVRSDKVERSNRYLFDGEAILVPGEGRLGEIFHYINGKFDYHQRVYKISDFVNTNAKFVMYSMMRGFKRHALANTAKATVDSIRLPTLTEFCFRLPVEEEQQKIGQFFSKLDHLITLHQRKRFVAFFRQRECWWVAHYRREAKDRMTRSTSWFSSSRMTCK